MSQLVLLISPNVIKTHKNEPVFRELFEKHKYDNIKIIESFLKENNIQYKTEAGENEHGNPLLAYNIDEERLFGIKY